MNKNQYPADATLINAKDLAEGQDFIYNYAGGIRTVYTALRVRTGSGQTVITYRVKGDRIISEFYTAGFSTLVLV